MNKKPDIIALRTLRKTSYIGGRALSQGGHFMHRVEHKLSRVITARGGGFTAGRPIESLVLEAFPQMTPIFPALPQIGQKPAVVVFAFLDPKGFYGGIATLLRVAGHLASTLGYNLRVIQTTGFSNDTAVLDFLKKDGIIIPKERFSTYDASRRHTGKAFDLPLHPEDILVVSAWWDAYVASLLPLQKKFLYLIQDHEPIFYNNGDASVFADQTYFSEKFIPLCNTEVLYNFFGTNGYDYIRKNATWFEPAPAPHVGKPTGEYAAKPTGVKRLFMYGRPHVHRNLYYNALRAVNIAMQDSALRGQQWELFMAGQAGTPAIRLDSGHTITNLGKMDLDEYYSFAQTIDVALSPMLAPHPNYPTLELASLGAAVVSTKYKNKQDLSNYSPNILMAEPTAEDMAVKLIAAATMPEDVRAANMQKNHIGGDWNKALHDPIAQVLKKYK